MSTPFARWAQSISSATTLEARKQLMSEVAQWRAAHLIDVVGQREAAFAMACLLRDVGNSEGALREAQSLVSLCRTPPNAEEDQLNAAYDLVKALGGTATRPKPAAKRAKNRSEKPRKEESRQPSGDVVERAVAAALSEDYGQAFRLLKGKKGPRFQLIRTWVDLRRAMAAEGAERDVQLGRVLSRLESGLAEVPKSAAAKQADDKPAREPQSRVEKLMGRVVPPRRARALKVIQSFVQANPGRADAIAAAALRDHLEANGAAPAPWLAGLVSLAEQAGGTEVSTAKDELRAAGSEALTIYEDAGYATLRSYQDAAREAGVEFVELRRGVLREAPDNARLWTLRLRGKAGEGVIAVAPEEGDGLPENLLSDMVKRLRGLAPHVVVEAPGVANTGLRGALAVSDVATVDPGGALEHLVATLGKAPATTKPEAAAVSAAPAAPSHKVLVEKVKEALSADELPDSATLEALVAPIKRVRDLLEFAETLEGESAPAKVMALIRALHATIPGHVRLLQATTLLIRTQLAHPESGASALLVEGDVAERLGGSGMGLLLDTVHATHREGWRLHRILQGVTRRERRESPALDVLAEPMGPLWRVLLDKGDVRGEIWVAESLAPEGQAGLPQLALRDANRAAVVGEGLQSAWAAVGAPEVVAVEGLGELLRGWKATGN